MVRVWRCSVARRLRAARRRSRSSSKRSAAWVSWRERQVSSTSELVMPWWTKRLSGPMPSASQVRKAMTSCRVSASMASMRARSASSMAASMGSPRARMVRAASDGMAPRAAMASAAAASMANHRRYRLIGAQMAAIAGRV